MRKNTGYLFLGAALAAWLWGAVRAGVRPAAADPPVAPSPGRGIANPPVPQWHMLAGTVTSVDVAREQLWLTPDRLPPAGKTEPLNPINNIVQFAIDDGTRLVGSQGRALAFWRLHAGDRVKVWYRPSGKKQYVRAIELMPAPPFEKG